MKRFKISIYLFIIFYLFSYNNVLAANSCKTQITETTFTETTKIAVNAETKPAQTDAGGGGKSKTKAGGIGNAFFEFFWVADDGTIYPVTGCTNSSNCDDAENYGKNRTIDMSKYLGDVNVMDEWQEGDVWNFSTKNFSTAFDKLAKEFFVNDEITDKGIEFASDIVGRELSSEEAKNFLSTGQGDVQLNYLVRDDYGNYIVANSDNIDSISDRYGFMDAIFDAIMGTTVLTEDSTILNEHGWLSMVPSTELSTKKTKRTVTICEDCGDPNNPSFPNAPEPPSPPEGECPPHYSCEQRFGEKICNGAKTRTCENASTKGGGCGGFSYQEDANVMYCANKIGREVPGTSGLSHYYCYEYGNVSAPSTPSTVFANRGFNLNGSFSATETRVCVKDDGANIWAKYAKQMTLYLNAQADVDCKSKEIEQQEKYIEELEYYLSGLKAALQEVQSINCGRCTKGTCSGSCGSSEDPGYANCQASMATCLANVEKAYKSCQEKVSECETSKTNTISSLDDSIKTAEDALLVAREYLEKLIEELEALQAIADAYLALAQQAAGYLASYSAADGNIVTTSNSISVTPPTAKFAGYTMVSGQVNAVNKNSATFEKIENEQNSLPINFQFYVPNVANNTNGNVSASVSGIGINLNLNYDWSCDFNILNFVHCAHDDCIPDSGPGSYKLIFRPISLTEPFPNDREPGANWTDEMTEKIIKNNRNVSDYEVYNLEPMYTIKLTPSDIKDIRTYNNQNSYNSFDDMECTNGIECRSTFLTDSSLFSTPISGCGMSSDWNACFSDSLSDYKASITTGINEKKNVASLFKEGVEH